MNFRHAAALALVGWYLLVPLPRHPEAPLSLWTQIGSYDTAKECTDAQTQAIIRATTSDFHFREVTVEQTRNAFLESQCIETDDPRLKSN
jgi:hypothetical protein